MHYVLIGFGSNQGDSVRICGEALEVLRQHPQIEVLKVSSFYRTEPVGMVEQDWFTNGVAICETSLEPEGLLNALQRIEAGFGRVREACGGPRTLDLDILAFEDCRIEYPGLIIPHPRLHERRFVLLPLVEIAPHWLHPVLKLQAKEMLDRISGQGNQKAERLKIS
ncbi:MAG: 2-amino-4-hydroxy-6-hydroxymethyldihydropteridine diphosphokinase [Syntrophobacteraceae bacterium]